MTELADIIERIARLPAWAWMWTLALTIYFTCKCVVWSPRRDGGTVIQQAGFFLGWPGMDARSFFRGTPPPAPAPREWLIVTCKTLIGAALVWLTARLFDPARPMLGAWTAMIGLALLLHFGIMHLATLAWQRAGVDATPLMRHPLRSRSLADFWGRRWNTGFNALARELVFKPLTPRIGIIGATAAVFLVSGVLHDAVISLPARGGYGLPTLYFLIQLAGVLLERTMPMRRLMRHRAIGWLYALAFTITPLPLLFHEPFVRRVIIPFLHAIGALP